MNNQKGYTTMEIMLVFVAIVIVPLIIWAISLWTDRNLDFWLTFFKGSVVDVPMWMSVVITFVLNGVVVALNIVGELLRLLV